MFKELRREERSVFWMQLLQPPPVLVLLVPPHLPASQPWLTFWFTYICWHVFAHVHICAYLLWYICNFCKCASTYQGPKVTVCWGEYATYKWSYWYCLTFRIQRPKVQKFGTPLPFFRDLFVIRPEARSWQNNQSIFTFAIKESHPSRDRLDAFLAIIIMRRSTMDKSMGTCQTDQHVKNPCKAYK